MGHRYYAPTAAGRYDLALLYSHERDLPPGTPRPVPTSQWPPENVRLLEKYKAWLIDGGTAEYPTKTIYLPMAGHILGLNPVPHEQINLENDLEKAMEYVQAKGAGSHWLKACRNGLEKFKRFLRLERGLGEIKKTKSFDIASHTQGFPTWLVTELERYQRICQRNWRIARIDKSICEFWQKHGVIWRFFIEKQGVQKIEDLKRKHILDYIDDRLAAGIAIKSVNMQVHILRGFLLFLLEEGYSIPQSILRVPRLKVPDSLPKYLTDEQVKVIRDDIEREVFEAKTAALRRLALLDRAAFYLLWQGGLRLGEVEELRLEDLDFPSQRLSVRNGKGLKDRTVYLAPNVLQTLQAYLDVRGEGSSDHVFLFRNAALSKDFIRSRLKTIGKQVGVKVYPHRLRHTCATQLLNAGCRITSIQAFLGHKKLNTTMIYARAHDQTVAEDYFAAMSRVEQRMEIAPTVEPEPEMQDEVVKVPETAKIMTWIDLLALPELEQEQRTEIAESLKRVFSASLTSLHPPPGG